MTATRDLPIPKTIDEFIQYYDGWIDGAIEKISRSRIRRGSDEAMDVKQQVYVRLIQQKHIEKYDATKGSFSHHVYRVVLHVLSNMWDKNTRTPTAHAMPVVETATTDPELQGALVLETFQSMMDESLERRAVTGQLLDKFESYLEEQSKPWGSEVETSCGVQQKSLALVFKLMRMGLEQKEIAVELRVTNSSVFSYIAKIKAFADQFKNFAMCV